MCCGSSGLTETRPSSDRIRRATCHVLIGKVNSRVCCKADTSMFLTRHPWRCQLPQVRGYRRKTAETLFQKESRSVFRQASPTDPHLHIQLLYAMASSTNRQIACVLLHSVEHRGVLHSMVRNTARATCCTCGLTQRCAAPHCKAGTGRVPSVCILAATLGTTGTPLRWFVSALVITNGCITGHKWRSGSSLGTASLMPFELQACHVRSGSPFS